MNRWPHEVDYHTQAEIRAAVDDSYWQAFRMTLKGLSTQQKLIQLEHYMTVTPEPVRKVRVDNYINALRRGGQLDMNNNVAH